MASTLTRPSATLSRLAGEGTAVFSSMPENSGAPISGTRPGAAPPSGFSLDALWSGFYDA